MTVDSLVKEFENWLYGRVSRRTRQRYLQIITELILLEGDPRLLDKTKLRNYRTTIETYRDNNGRIRQCAASTINQKRSAVKKLYQFMVERDLVTEDLSSQVEAQKIPKRLPKPVDEAEVRQILKQIKDRIAAEDTPEAKQDLALVELLYGSGLRREEAGMLTLSCIEGPTTLRVIGKGDKERIAPLNQHEYIALRDWVLTYRGDDRTQQLLSEFNDPDLAFTDLKRRMPDASVFVTPSTGRAYSDWKDPGQAVYLRIKHYADLLGLRVHPHQFRHSYATVLIENNANLMAVSESMGHASVATTQIYTQVAKGRVTELGLRHSRNDWEE